MFGGFSQFTQNLTDSGKYYHNQKQYYQHSNIQPINSNYNPLNLDLIQKQSDVIILKNFHKLSYPIQFSMTNQFCPICGKFVQQNQKNLTYESRKFNKNFLAHQQCLNKQEASTLLSNYYEENQQAKILPFGLKKVEKSLALGGEQYFLQLKISHTLSDLVFLKQSSKLSSNSMNIRWQIHLDQQTDPYIPTIICFPFSDFKLDLHLTCMATGQKTIYKTYINLGKLKYNQLKVITASSQQMKIQINIFYTQQQKQNLIDQMNFKYRYNLQLPVPIIEIAAIQTILPEQDQDKDFQCSVIENVINDNLSQISTIQLNSKSLNLSCITPENFLDRSQKFEFDRLIISQSLGAFVRNNTQSRQFQTFLNQANNKQVDLIIQTLYLELPELITHEYANYMVQKLFSVCNYTQRLKVMQRLHQDITNIVRNKQGTHTIQALIKFFTNDQEFKLMCQSIEQNFFELSCHPNATHFIQKIIALFPIIHTYKFFEYTQKNFLSFALDKNAMCVIKHMMKLIAQLQKNNNSSQQIKQLIGQVKKKIINQVTFCIDKIILDAYGNYIIQFCYELFGEQKCAGITQMITQRFIQFSLQKYSSNVVYKCVNTYWKKKQNFNKLKQNLNSDAIIQLFRNKDGNKILLQIMQKHQNVPVRDKIYNQLVIGEPTKFHHDRWGQVLGIRSGNVGTQFTSFSDALKKSNPYKSSNTMSSSNNSNKRSKHNYQ